MSMRALEEALEVWTGLYRSKMKAAMIQKVVGPFLTEKPVLSHKDPFPGLQHRCKNRKRCEKQ
jgi:hypothetical protein